jgi:hypothetical protein
MWMRLFFGVLFVIVGVLIFTGSLNWDVLPNMIDNFTRVWPFIFVLIGLSIISKLKGFHWVKFIHTIVSVLFFCFIVFWPSKAVYDQHITRTPIAVQLSENFTEYTIETKGVAYELLFIEATDITARTITGELISRNEGYDVRQINNIISFDFEDINPVSFVRPGTNLVKMYVPSGYTYQLIATGANITVGIELFESTLKTLDIKSGIANVKAKTRKIGETLSIWLESGILHADFYTPAGTTWNAKLEGGIKNTTFSDDLPEKIVEPQMNFRINSGIINFTLNSIYKEE